MPELPKLSLKKKNTSFWVAVLLSLAAAFSLYATFHLVYRPVGVVMVAREVRPGEQIRKDALREGTVFAGDLAPGAVRSLDAAVGKYAASSLYPGEQLIADRLVQDPDKATGAFSYLQPDETYVGFNSEEARWPKGIKEGDTVTAVAVMDTGARIVGTRLKVIGTDKPVPVLGQVQVMKQAVPDNASTITIAVPRNLVAELLYAKARAKAFYLLPEHPKLVFREEGETVSAESKPGPQKQ
ncbi:hypothetical protein G7K71_08250 [Desulfofundulus sp. TPOSR]|uniref:SAF domain-containing protein n=1 Tax=Desulfofundulus sp. TPOSR TaxID=2714340 RepID=UPI00140C4D4D|nr:SAF domain-containing protein [Desulfofundulus sp. TPOSR]NHM26974.1 hypothetical protein [Desulfofundulus sp. TPOSR]